MKSIIFWDVTPCNPLSFTRRFGGTYRLNLQGRRIVQQTGEQTATLRTTRRHIPEDDTLQYWFGLNNLLQNNVVNIHTICCQQCCAGVNAALEAALYALGVSAFLSRLYLQYTSILRGPPPSPRPISRITYSWRRKCWWPRGSVRGPSVGIHTI
jgi:hypothetical protein